MPKLILTLCAVVFIALGFALLISPVAILAKVDIVFESPTAFADIRADYGGCILGVGVFLAWCCLSQSRVQAGLCCCALTLSGYALARLYSLMVDGIPANIIFVLLIVEIAGAITCFIAMKKAVEAAS